MREFLQQVSQAFGEWRDASRRIRIANASIIAAERTLRSAERDLQNAQSELSKTRSLIRQIQEAESISDPTCRSFVIAALSRKPEARFQ